jgi:hypothetical protein
LGDVGVVATVYVNGDLVGSRGWKPFVFDITEKAAVGANELTIEVRNTIANRMTLYGDGRWDATPPQRLVSGLLGPVRLRLVEFK